MRRSSIRRIEIAVFAITAVIAAMLLHSPAGGVGYFSPDTLESKSQDRDFFPRSTIYRAELTDYLIQNGYWSPKMTRRPRWMQMFRWMPDMRDGESRLHRELFWRKSEWIAWTESNPDLAALLWPRLLSTLRGGNRVQSESKAVDLLWRVRMAGDEGEARKAIIDPL